MPESISMPCCGPGVPQSIWLPMKQPDEELDYPLDISAPLINSDDNVANMTFVYTPWGDGEWNIIQFNLIDGPCLPGSLIILWIGGGVAGRVYEGKLDVYTNGGRTFSYKILQKIDPSRAATPWVIPPNITDSAEITYTVPPLGPVVGMLTETGADGTLIGQGLDL